MSKSFLFDLNKCVGCHACVVACSIENNLEPEIVWRNISTYNSFAHPALPVFHFSLACNHCEKAPCKENCPANAYSKDAETGAIIHHPEKCIGCKYCTWACPYDAPKYNPLKSIVEKCTFCNSRIKDGLKPSCANLCPTGALDFEDKSERDNYNNIDGFTEIKINPSLRIIPLRRQLPPKMFVKEIGNIQMIHQQQPSKVSVKHEWHLAIFSIIVSVLTGIVTSTSFSPFPVNPYIFLFFGIFALLLASLHIGQKKIAYRAIYNFRSSWLSREIVFYSLFLLSSFIFLLFFPDVYILGWISAGLGFITLFSIDMIYHVTRKPTPSDLHSAHVFLSGMFFTGLFMKNFIVFSIIGIIKFGLYVYRKYYFKQKMKSTRIMASAWRLDLMLSFPLLLWWFNPPFVFWYVMACIVIGEIIDRFEYYAELDVITPKKQIQLDIENKNEAEKS